MSRVRRAPLLVALAALACAPGGGALLPEERVAAIEPGVTTDAQIREWFGDPDAVEIDLLGAAAWSYAREDRPYARRGFGRWVLGPVARFLEAYVLYPPTQPETRKRVRDAFRVSFEPDGVVRDFRYRRSAPAP